MARETYYPTGPLYLHPAGIEMEHDALWRVDVETYPAEPHSWGGSRGAETEVTATLLRWSVDRDRAAAVSIDGAAEIARQEEIFAELFDVQSAQEDALAEYGDWLRDQQSDRLHAAE